MRSPLEALEKLAPLETFDPSAFIAAEDTDLITAQRSIRYLRPEPQIASLQLGEFYGFHAHWVRSMTGFVNELAQLIRTNEDAIGHRSSRRL
jgi:hypothetical protein